MKVQMMNNINLKIFQYILRHLKFEDEHLQAAKPFNEANVLSLCWGSKRKKVNKKNKAPYQTNLKKQKKYAKYGGKKDKTKLKCYNCGSLSHFACERIQRIYYL